jgi:hypothetical protein
MKEPKFPEISKRPTWKARVVGLAVLLTTAAYEAIKQRNFGNLTPRESHTITIFYCATLVFILSALFLQRERPRVERIRRWNSNFLGYSAADI